MGMKLPIAMVWGITMGHLFGLSNGYAHYWRHVVDLELFGVPSGKISYGHRFLTPSKDHGLGEAIVINHHNYSEQLMKEH